MQLTEKLNLIRDRLRANASNVMEVSGSFSAELETGHTVYIYPETYDNSITARVETRAPDTDTQILEMETVRILLSEIFPFADVAEFTLFSSQKNRYIYTASIDVIEAGGKHERGGETEDATTDISQIPGETDPPNPPSGVKKELQLQDKLDLIRDGILAGGLTPMEVSGSFRVEFGPNQYVYIFPEIRDNSITIRFETRQTDADKRVLEAASIHDRLTQLFPFSGVGELKPAESYGSRFVYVAGMNFENREANATPSLEEAFAQMEAVDAKALRESLDNMYLKRSSRLRIALSKIHRSMEDITDFELSIQNEAKKIVTPEDQTELQMVRGLYNDGPLKPIVDLLWDEVFQRSNA